MCHYVNNYCCPLSHCVTVTLYICTATSWRSSCGGDFVQQTKPFPPALPRLGVLRAGVILYDTRNDFRNALPRLGVHRAGDISYSSPQPT